MCLLWILVKIVCKYELKGKKIFDRLFLVIEIIVLENIYKIKRKGYVFSVNVIGNC